MPYGEKNEIKVSNVDYLARDFNDLKAALIRYTNLISQIHIKISMKHHLV